jgi:hypothetical protein
VLGRHREKLRASAFVLVLTAGTRAFAEAPPDAEGGVGNAPASEEPTEVTVHGERPGEERHITTQEARKTPGAFGDPLRAVEMLPGVTPIASGLPYFYLRGAPPGNVGYFLDGVQVPTLFHLGAGPSVIHPSLIDGVTLYPGPYPARYGRFGAGVVTAETAPPATDLGGEASVRLVDAGAVVRTPFADYRGSAAVGGRYSYTGAIVSLFAPEIDVSYWDYQALASYDLTANDTLGLVWFGEADFLSEERASGTTTLYDTEFHRVDLRYDRKLGGGGKLRVATTLGTDHSKLEEGQVVLGSRTLAVRAELTAPLERAVLMHAGADTVFGRYSFDFHENGDSRFAPGIAEFYSRTLGARDDVTSGAWLDMELLAAPGIRVEPGVRVDVWSSGEKTLVSADPRLLAEFDATKTLTFSQGLGIVHQRPSFTVPLAGVQPVLDELQTSLQASSGVRVRLPEDVTASMTVYEALHLNLTDALASARIFNTGALSPVVNRSNGRSYGLELMIGRSLTRRLGGHLAYTLSRSERTFGPVSAPGPFDRTHVVSGSLGYDFGRGWRAGARGSFYTGFPVDVAYPRAASDPPRTAPFWRLDWRVDKTWRLGRNGSIALVLEVLNTTLNRETLRESCSAYVCKSELIGPVTVPSLGVEAAF